MKVKISNDGLHASEVNPMGEKKPIKVKSSFGKIDRFYNDRMLQKWQEAEGKLRTFEIEGAPIMWSEFAFNKLHEAELLPNGKIKITP